MKKLIRAGSRLASFKLLKVPRACLNISSFETLGEILCLDLTADTLSLLLLLLNGLRRKLLGGFGIPSI